MKNLLAVLLLVCFTLPLSSQHKHKTKHKTNTQHSVTPVDTVKVVTTSTATSEPTLQELNNERYMFYMKIAGLIIVAVIIFAILSSRAARKKKEREQEEKAENERYAKVKLKDEINLAFKNGEIWETHLAEINSKYPQLNSGQLFGALESARQQKRRMDYLTAKYTEEEVSKIVHHQYWIGMTEEQLVDAKGAPDKVEVEQLKTKTKRILIYGNKSSGDVFNFVDGALERFKDR